MYLKLLVFLFPFLILCQENTTNFSTSICGKWLEEKKQSHIEIYKTIDGLYEGKIVWLAEPLTKDGQVKKDDKNPNIELREQTIAGLIIVKELKYLGQNEWGKGNIYDARSGKTYSLNAKLKDKNTLFMRGYLGFSLIGKTTTWTRVE
tara:strand:+ start:1971 stop:2414 length:444 start_codon:yes stop_codon:yes gene_type:complete